MCRPVSEYKEVIFVSQDGILPVARCAARHAGGGFTLIELLAVVSLIALLCTISLGAWQGAAGRAARDQAKAELAVLTDALECYRGHYGDFPRCGDASLLRSSLEGRLGPRGAPAAGRSFLPPQGLALEPIEGSGAEPGTVLDPWGNPYRYQYPAPASSVIDGFLLYSCGPDGREEPDGPLSSGPANADNLAAGDW